MNIKKKPLRHFSSVEIENIKIASEVSGPEELVELALSILEKKKELINSYSLDDSIDYIN